MNTMIPATAAKRNPKTMGPIKGIRIRNPTAAPIGSANPDATNEDLKKVGILDASKDDGGMSVNSEPKIPVDFAIERYLTKKR